MNIEILVSLVFIEFFSITLYKIDEVFPILLCSICININSFACVLSKQDTLHCKTTMGKFEAAKN